jgi:hypothetical protein
LMPISMKFAQTFESCITWPKNRYVDNLKNFNASVCRFKNV